MAIRVQWEGPFFSNKSLALVNREIVLGLAQKGELELGITSGELANGFSWDADQIETLRALEKGASVPADITVRHRWPLNPHPPREGKWVIMQPWEFGPVPRKWHDALRFGADQVWVYSGFNRDSYLESGIPADKVRVVPLGVHRAMLTPGGAYPLKTRKRFKFLFVGGTILRKGIDILLDSYSRTFGPTDDVCLVIKDFGTDSFYKNQTHEQTIRELQANPRIAEIEYIDEELTPEQLRDLYHSCDCLVHPYRGEGFGLPIAEAMACGLPVIVPDQGGASDFCTPESAILVKSHRALIPRQHAIGLDTIEAPWWVEVELHTLRARMREVYESPDSYRAIAEAGRKKILTGFTWEAAADAAARHLAEVSGADGLVRAESELQHRLRVETGVRRWQAGDADGAIRHFARAQEARVDRDVTFNLAAILLEKGDHLTAGPLLQELLEDLSPEVDSELYAEVCALLAISHTAAGKVTEARKLLGSALESLPENVQLRAALGGLPHEGRLSNPGVEGIRWWAPIFNSTGYADESRSFLLGLHRSGEWNIRLHSHDQVVDRGLLPKADFDLLAEYTRRAVERPELDFQHAPPSGFVPPVAPKSVARTMFETDRIPDDWVEKCNGFTEVWVPTEFNRETFAGAGVIRDKLRVVPGCIDARKFDPELYHPVRLTKRNVFSFVSVFDFTPRKAWDVLLRAYFEEFSASEPVCLVVKVVSTFTDALTPTQRVKEFIRKHGFRNIPQHILIDEHYSENDLRTLYRSCDAFVLPTRGEGWGRPYMEAMAFGMPTIGTRWSGNLEFMNDSNSFLIDIDGLEPCEARWPEMPFYAGQQWAVPSVASTRKWMRYVFENQGEARRRGEQARRDILLKYDQPVVAERLKSEFLRLLAA